MVRQHRTGSNQRQQDDRDESPLVHDNSPKIGRTGNWIFLLPECTAIEAFSV
jgi:hypothetical protein